MISDNERRETARRLRELDHSDLQESLICAYLDALGIKGYEDWIGIAHRLADLIEPSCDRDALPKADDMLECDGECSERECGKGTFCEAPTIADYRTSEALEVES